MTFTEMMMFNGNAEQLEEYQKLLKKKTRLGNKIGKLSDAIDDERLSIEVITGDGDENYVMTERDEELFQKHVKIRRELEIKLAKAWDDFTITEKMIQDLQRRK